MTFSDNPEPRRPVRLLKRPRGLVRLQLGVRTLAARYGVWSGRTPSLVSVELVAKRAAEAQARRTDNTTAGIEITVTTEDRRRPMPDRL